MALCKRLLDWLDTKTSLRLVQMFPLWSYVLSNHRQKLGQWNLRSSFYSDQGEHKSGLKVDRCWAGQSIIYESENLCFLWRFIKQGQNDILSCDIFTIWKFLCHKFENDCRILFSAMKSQLHLRFLWATIFEIFHDSCLIRIPQNKDLQRNDRIGQEWCCLVLSLQHNIVCIH